MPLHCPSCTTVLEQTLYAEHAVEHCPSCGGMLIDANELDHHIAMSTKGVQIKQATEVTTQELIRPFLLKLQKRCPRDATPMKYCNYGHDSNVLLEQCPSCKVLWVLHSQVLPLAAYLKRYPGLKNFGERIDREGRHQYINQNVVSDSRVVLTTTPIPLGDTAEPLAFPWIVLALIVFETLIFVGSIWAGGITTSLISALALRPQDILQFQNLHTLLTHQLLHGDLLHLFGNLFTLWIFGDNIESRMGPRLFLLFYLTAGVFAGVVASLLALDPSIPQIGASGAITAVMGSYLVLYPREKLKVLFLNSIWGITVWKYLLFWLVTQVGSLAFEHWSGAVSSISFAAHVGGFVFGVGVTLMLRRFRLLIRELNIFQNPLTPSP